MSVVWARSLTPASRSWLTAVRICCSEMPVSSKSLDELEHEDVAEAVEPLRAGAGGTAHGGLDELGARPVVELAVGDAGGTRGDGAAVPDLVVQVGKTVGEEEPEVVALVAVVSVGHDPYLTFIVNVTVGATPFRVSSRPTPTGDIRSNTSACRARL